MNEEPETQDDGREVEPFDGDDTDELEIDEEFDEEGEADA